ncbi:unnamed protein product [Calypogeia fissa]
MNDSKVSLIRYEILKMKFLERGGRLMENVDKTTTHVVTSTWATVAEKECCCQQCPFRVQSTVKIVTCMGVDVNLSP